MGGGNSNVVAAPCDPSVILCEVTVRRGTRHRGGARMVDFDNGYLKLNTAQTFRNEQIASSIKFLQSQKNNVTYSEE